MGLDVLYVSPHPDDVAFSAAGQIEEDRKAGLRVGVVTLFWAHGGPAWCGNVEERRREDLAFAEQAQVERSEASFLDAIVRHPRYTSARHLLGRLPPDEEPLICRVTAYLQTFIDNGCRRVVAPLGVGHHIDHQIAFAAARRLTQCTVHHYEDTPYVLLPSQLPRRFEHLGYSLAERDPSLRRAAYLSELGALARAWMNLPVVHEQVSRLIRPFAAAALVAPDLLRRPASRSAGQVHPTLHPATADLKQRAVACYASQWPQFFPSLDAWCSALGTYGHQLGEEGMRERSWRLD